MTLLQEQYSDMKPLQQHKLFHQKKKKSTSLINNTMMLLPPMMTLQSIDTRLVIPPSEQNYDRPIGIPARSVKVYIYVLGVDMGGH